MIDFNVFKYGKKYALTMSFDDGAYDDKLTEIFNNYKIKGTFHLNLSSESFKNSDITPDMLHERYKGHEISCHGCLHKTLTYLPVQQLYSEIFENRRVLEEFAGYPVIGHSYANGKYSDEVISALKSMGIVYSRTTKNTGDFALPNDFMKWHPTCHYKQCMEYGRKLLDSMHGYFGYPKLLYVWGHGHELEHNSHWGMMDEFCSMMSENESIWYATNIEIYNYITAQRRLVISADESMVFNPSSMEIWFAKDDNIYSAAPGQMLNL